MRAPTFVKQHETKYDQDGVCCCLELRTFKKRPKEMQKTLNRFKLSHAHFCSNKKTFQFI